MFELDAPSIVKNDFDPILRQYVGYSVVRLIQGFI